MDLKLILNDENTMSGYNCIFKNGKWINYNVSVIRKNKFNENKPTNTTAYVSVSCDNKVINQLTFNLYEFVKWCKTNNINLI